MIGTVDSNVIGCGISFESTVPIVCKNDIQECGVTLEVVQTEKDGLLQFCSTR